MVQCREENNEMGNISRDALTLEKVGDVEIIYSDSAQVKVRVTGPEMLYNTDPAAPNQTFPKGVRTFFYDPLQNQQSVLSGKYAIRDERARRVVIRDSVVWESVTDGKLETSELVWDETTNIIRSTKFCKITRQNDVIYGFNFETNDKLTSWKIQQPTGALKVDEINKEL
jgi:hypothetical protein